MVFIQRELFTWKIVTKNVCSRLRFGMVWRKDFNSFKNEMEE